MATAISDEEISKLSRKETGHTHQLILHNDEVNTFPHIMNNLVLFCRHTPLQAEQCALIAHHNGSCEVKRGDYISLEEICMNLRHNNIITEIKS